MNCKHVQELMPLYAGSDLDEKRLGMVAEHIRSCAECEVSADEYSATINLVQQLTPPPFDDSLYSGIRMRVLREIEHDRSAPGLVEAFISYFRPRTALAMAKALVLIVGVFTVYFVTNRPAAPQTEVVLQPDGAAPATEIRVPDEFPGSRPVDPPQGIVTEPTAGRANGSPHRKRSATAAAVGKAITPRKIPSRTPTAFPAANNLAVLQAPDREKTVRMEIQTRDPNIRIIWFSNQPAKQSSRN